MLGCIFTLFSFLPLISSPAWWIRVLDFPRLHVAVLLSIVMAAYVVSYELQEPLEYVMVAVWALAILNELRYIIHFTPLRRVEALRTEQAKPANAFTLMISNVRMVNNKYDKFLERVLQEDPDMVIMNEPNQSWHDNVCQVMDERYPYAIKKPLENTYGMLFWSKHKLHDSEIRYLVEEGIPSFYTVVELPGGNKFCLFTVHPQPPRLMLNTETREAELLLVAKEAKKAPYPAVVAGDLNDVAWSNTTKLFKETSGMIDPRVGRGFYNTYNAHVPIFRYPLDHVFYDPVFRLVSLRRLQKFGSDHFPMVITLNYEPQHEKEQEHPHADQEDKQEANELIQEGLEKGEERNQEKHHEQEKSE